MIIARLLSPSPLVGFGTTNSTRTWEPTLSSDQLRGEACMVRYIDDFVLCFQYRADALRVQEALAKRLRRFSLTLESTKTKLVEFGRYAQRHAGKRGRRRPETIYFLGFTLYCTRNLKGNFKVGMRTEKSRLRRSLTSLQALMRQIRHLTIHEQVDNLNNVLRGHRCPRVCCVDATAQE